MTTRLAIALLIALGGQVLYHLSQKSVPSNAHPVVALIVFYVVAILCSLPLFLVYPMERGIIEEARRMNAFVLATGFAIVLIELGFLLAYRAGGNLSTAFVFTSAAVAGLLLLLGAVLFKEAISPVRIAGIGFCLVGIALLARQ